jgi:glutamate dehydrogenase (NAD(P)+)
VDVGRLARARVGDRQGVVHCIVEWARESPLRPQRIDLQPCRASATSIERGEDPRPDGRFADRRRRLEGLHLNGRRHQRFNAGRPRDTRRIRRRLPASRAITPRRILRDAGRRLHPAALELEIGVAEAKALNVRLIVEGANGPTETAAEPILREKNIDLIPDILANSGGVVVSYYEWLQNKRSERWDLEEVEERLAKRMKRTYLPVSEYAAAKKCDWRVAAMCIALDRIGKAYTERGIFP